MKKTLAAFLVLLAILPVSAQSQETYFGKNKVQYRDFNWKFIQTRRFDIYFYDDAYPIAKFTADVLEKAYDEVTRELDYRIQRRVPVFVYISHNDFQQTNIVSELLPEGVGGFTEAFKNRIVIPFTGSFEDYRHVLHHELTHAVVYDMLFGGNLASIISRQRLFNMPLWFAEGYAEYSSRHGWDYQSDMYVRDATINGYLTPPDYLGGFLAYKQGQAMVKYIADKYGEDKLGDLIQKGKVHLSMNKAMKASIGVSEEDFYKEFSKEMKRRYWPEIAKRKEAPDISKQLTKAREDGSYFNEKPVYTPDGGRIAIFSDISDYTEIILISALDGKKIESLVKGERSGDLESLHSYVSGMSFSPDGKSLVFVAKHKGQDALMFLDVKDKDVYKKLRLPFRGIVSPAWSPDGKKIAFSALSDNTRDLYVLDIASESFRQITDDRFDDVDPTWMPGSEELIFTSDRPHPQNPVLNNMGHPYVKSDSAFMPGGFAYGTYNLFRIDVASERIQPVDVGPGSNRNPDVSPDGRKVAFISNRNGIDNIYIGMLDSAKNYAVTDLLTGAHDLSWAPDGDRIAYSAFFQGAFDIFVLKDLIPAGDNGVLTPTDYVLGKYNLLPGATASRDSVKITAPDSAIIRPPIPLGASDTLAHVADSTGNHIATSDTTVLAAKPSDTAVTSTGIIDDEYVFVSDRKDPLDSLLAPIPRDSLGNTQPLAEPPSFDSIPPPLPSGEYDIKKYSVKFTPDFVGGGFSYNTFFGVRGQSYFVFSDYLGNHQIYVALDLVNTIDQSFIQAYYFNNTRRVNLGAGFFHTKNFYTDNRDYLFSDRFYGIQGFAQRPFSMFSRLEFGASQYFIDREYYDIQDTRPNRSSQVTTGQLSWVFDNVLWGYTGPINGRRAKISLDGGVNFFDAGDIEFYSAELDYRKYWHIKGQVSMALRFAGGASFGRTPKLYFLGGTTNWIGSRTLDAQVYEVENLYFSEVITPVRGIDYYDWAGDRFGLMNWELRFPLVQVLAMKYPLPIVLTNITGVLFTDVGSTWYGNDFKIGTSEGGRSRLLDLHTGFGAGLRLNLFGLALLRYDIAWSTDFYNITKSPSHYFSLGADF